MTKTGHDNRVLFVHDGPLLVNGTGYYGISFTNTLVRRYQSFGSTVTFMMRLRSFEHDTTGYNKIDAPAFRFRKLPEFKTIGTVLNRRRVRKIIHREVEEHDVILVRLPSSAGAMAFHHARRLGKPVLVEFVACVFDALWNYGIKGKILAPYKYLLYRNLMKYAGHTIYVTTKFLQDRYPSPGKSIGLSDVVLYAMDDGIVEQRLEKIRSFNGSTPLALGTVAALDVPYKRQADVIRALAGLKREGLRFRYRLVGTGNQERLKKLIRKLDVEDLVEIVGPLTHDNIFGFLDEIDLYIQPSKQEGLPRAVVEAMSRACPVLGSTAGGIPELAGSECLFRPGHIAGIRSLLRKTDPEFMEEHAVKNFFKAKAFDHKSLEALRKQFYESFKADYGI